MRACPRCHVVYSTAVEYCAIDGTQVVETEHDPMLGVAFDRYRILERLGEGGMAAVYRAAHQVLEREHAIKILYGELASDAEFAERFRREAQAASRISHPNVVQVIDFGTTTEGATFMIMELLRGRTLGRAISDDGPFMPERAARVMIDVAAGLSAAHQIGFLHRDLKPGNVMLIFDKDGRETAKILDFGLVRMPEHDDTTNRLTKNGTTLGTPYYMAPEIISGQPASAASDLYSLGAMLFEMLAGSAPFRGSVPEILFKHTTEPVPALQRAGGLEKLVAHLLEKDPKQRPKSAEALRTAIEELGLVQDASPPAPGSSGARQSAPVASVPKKPKRWGAFKWVALCTPLILGVGLLVYEPARRELTKLLFSSEEPEKPKADEPTALRTKLDRIGTRLEHLPSSVSAQRAARWRAKHQALKSSASKDPLSETELTRLNKAAGELDRQIGR